MTYIKRLTMQGFKSFARKTEVPLENSMNVIVGPNGSGKSNITDALCFVLGRLSIKSIRAAKAANLLFSGNKSFKGSAEASVELVFDNKDNSFAIDKSEISIKRVVRKNGQSVYKINDSVKTRQELLELLSHAGIDPNGFNIVLQGEIQSLVKATSEERRKILEDVAGISIYENRKHKSIRELEKTQERLKEVNAVLKERNAYLKNLERERKDALNFQKLENSIKMCKKSLIVNSLAEKEKDLWGIKKLVDNNTKEIEKLKKQIREKNVGVEELQVKISALQKQINEVTNTQQDVLYKEISGLKADLAGLNVRHENFNNRINESRKRLDNLNEKNSSLEEEINQIQNASPNVKKKQEEQKKLQKRFDSLEQKRRRFYLLRSDLSKLEHQKQEKVKAIESSQREITSLEANLKTLSSEIKFENSVEKNEGLRLKTKEEIEEIKAKIESKEEEILSIEKRFAVLEDEIKRQESLRDEILNLDSCPVCRQDVNDEYKNNISKDSQEKIDKAEEERKEILKRKDKLTEETKELHEKLDSLNSKVSSLDIDIVKLQNITSRKQEISSLKKRQESLTEDNKNIEEQEDQLNKEFSILKDVESEYDNIRVRLQDLNFADIDVDSEIGVKQREISRISVEKKAIIRDIEESEVESKKIGVIIEEKKKSLSEKEEQEKEVFMKAKKLFDEKNDLEDRQKVLETDIIGLQHNIRSYEERIHNSNINKAQLEAKITSLKDDLTEYEGIDTIKAPVAQIKDRLSKAQFRISQLGNVNLRALEVFEQVKEQVELIKQKTDTVEEERQNILKIIDEIDRKKKKAFMTTLRAVNDIFSRNHNQLSKKGEVSLELEDKKDPFNAGVNIIVRFSKGRFFDITSLSGGEKTMIALSLIFAIQEYKPYSFYIFDEIDAALDKHNSELLAGLIKRYMKTGQYIIITHNDTLISEASTLYGVSMQENISKVVSLKV